MLENLFHKYFIMIEMLFVLCIVIVVVVVCSMLSFFIFSLYLGSLCFYIGLLYFLNACIHFEQWTGVLCDCIFEASQKRTTKSRATLLSTTLMCSYTHLERCKLSSVSITIAWVDTWLSASMWLFQAND